jgi:hypothetical protein
MGIGIRTALTSHATEASFHMAFSFASTASVHPFTTLPAQTSNVIDLHIAATPPLQYEDVDADEIMAAFQEEVEPYYDDLYRALADL